MLLDASWLKQTLAGLGHRTRRTTYTPSPISKQETFCLTSGMT